MQCQKSSRLFCDDMNTENQNQLKKTLFQIRDEGKRKTIIDALLLWNK